MRHDGVRLGLSLILMMCFAHPTWATDYALIVNVENDFAGETHDLKLKIQRLYLKQQRNWQPGVKAKVFARPEHSPEQQAFLIHVLDMNHSRLIAHWLSLKQKTGETPPRSIKRTPTVIRLVAKKVGAFGVVPATEALALNSRVRVLFRFTD